MRGRSSRCDGSSGGASSWCSGVRLLRGSAWHRSVARRSSPLKWEEKQARDREVRLPVITFEWDASKARANAERHGVTFEEAITAFADPLSSTIPDPDHSQDEERFLLLGLSSRRRLLVVVHTDRGDTIRVISARLASKRERRTYEES